jgi:predicted ATPase
LLIADGDFDSGLKRLHDAGDALRSAGFFQNYTPYLGTLAEALGAAGDVTRGLAAADEALDRVERTEERWCLAELLRVKGELLRQKGDEAVAEICFEDSLAVAREQETLAWELRTTTSLAQLRADQDRGHEAQRILAPIYASFTEGFGTADLQAAKALIEALPPPAAG